MSTPRHAPPAPAGPSTPLSLRAPPSKSATHRLMLLAALSDGPCTLRRPLLGADCRSTLAVLRGLGAQAQLTPEGDVHFEAFTPRRPAAALDCGNSGTTLRLLVGQAARWPFATTFTGDASLRSRPNGPLLAALRQLGVRVEADNDRAPITIRGPLPPAGPGGRVLELPGGLSSQFTSSLLLALAQAAGPSTLLLAPPVASRPYLELTTSLAALFGLGVQTRPGGQGLRFDLPGDQHPRPPSRIVPVEGDWSGAAFALVASALTGVPLRLSGLRMDSAQGDRKIVSILRRFGVEVTMEDGAGPETADDQAGQADDVGPIVHVMGGALASPGPIDVGDMPDLFPVLCALAACARGRTRLHGSPGLRHKECDRIAAMAAGLKAMDVRCEELRDGLIVWGGLPRGARLACHGDHRVHMALSVLALVADGQTAIDHPGCVAVSYPDFHAHRAAFAARLDPGALDRRGARRAP